MGSQVRSAALEAVEAVARCNLGLFTQSDAARYDVTGSLLAYHCNVSGRWRRVLPSVYAIAALPATERQQMLGALIWAGPGSVLSHRAAARVLRLDGIARRVAPELWSPRSRSAAGLIVHRGVVPEADIRRAGPLRHTSLVRTVTDLAAVFDDDRLETRFIQLVRTVDVPPPVRQHPLVSPDGWTMARLDLCWPEAALWVELDGRGPHGAPRAVFVDRHRQNEVTRSLQWSSLRYTWDDVTERGSDTALAVEATYRRRLQALATR